MWLNAYYYIFKGMIQITSMFLLYALYASLCHNMVTLYRVRKITVINDKCYVVWPVVFSFSCLVIVAFFLGDAGVADLLVDGITDGSLSELLHTLVVFLIIPYVVYSLFALCAERNKLTKQTRKESLIDFGILSDKDLFRRHIQLVVVFLVGIVPGCFAEFIPMMWKRVARTFGYRLFSCLSVVCFSFSGLCTSLIRMNDPYLKEKISGLIRKLIGEKETEADESLDVALMMEEDKLEESRDSFGSNLRLSNISKLSSSLTMTKSTYKQVENCIVYEVRRCKA